MQEKFTKFSTYTAKSIIEVVFERLTCDVLVKAR